MAKLAEKHAKDLAPWLNRLAEAYAGKRDFCKVMDEGDALKVKLSKVSDKVDLKKTLVDVIVRFGVADGYAYYRVTADKPLTLEHLPFSDGYQIPYAHIRGLTKADILRQEEGHRNMSLLFRKRG